MKDLHIQIEIDPELYSKNPDSSELGKKLISNSIELINEIGFELFTFKKLGDCIESNESSIYRYFENKHKFLIYLTNWYWGWKEYQLAFATANIHDPKEKLEQAIEILTREVEEDHSFNHINEVALNKIVINEYSKSYLTKEVDDENKEGYFVIYKRLSTRLKEMIADVNEGYPYPASLASTILAGSLHQHFLKDHFTSLTDCGKKTSPSQYFIHLTSNLLNS